MKVLPDNILKCMSAADRKKLNQRTASEVMANGEAKSEKELQRQIVSLLRLKGIEPIVNRFGKRTSNNVGTPDILFSVWEHFNDDGILGTMMPCAWEVKRPQGKLSPEQEAMHKKLTTPPNAWRVRIIRSVDQAIQELEAMGS